MFTMSYRQLRLLAFGVLFICAVVAMASISVHFNRFSEEYLSYQADAFLHGRVDISRSLIDAHGGITEDLVIRENKYYEVHSPLSSVILVPIVALFGPVGTQNAFQYLLIVVAASFAYLFFRRRGLDQATSWWLLFAFLFSSVFFGVSAILGYCYYIQVLGVALAFIALYEFSGRDRPWLIGLLTAAICATRSTAGLAMIIFFTLDTVFRPDHWRDRFKRLTIIALPIVLAVFAVALFNLAKFGNPFDSGYRDALTWFEPEASLRKEHGLFNVVFIARNLRYYFYELPWIGTDGTWYASARGISVFLISPIFLWLFALRTWNRLVMAAFVASAVVLGILLCLYSPGYFQLGPRYVCDFLPLLFLLLTMVFQKKMGTTPKVAIIFGAVVNVLIVLLWMRVTPYS